MKKIMTTKQFKFSQHKFPLWKRQMVKQYLSDNSTDTIFQSPFNGFHMIKFNMGNYRKVHHHKIGDVVVL